MGKNEEEGTSPKNLNLASSVSTSRPTQLDRWTTAKQQNAV